MIAQVFLDRTPEVFNKVELAMEFGKEDTKVTRSVDDFLDEGVLFLEIRLDFKNAFGTTSG